MFVQKPRGDPCEEESDPKSRPESAARPNHNNREATTIRLPATRTPRAQTAATGPIVQIPYRICVLA